MRGSLRGASVVLAACAAGVAWAQQEGAQPTTVHAPALRRIDLETHTPIRIITRQELEAARHLSLGELLQRLPFMGGSAANLNSNAGGDGSVLADIGGFGRARTVVMLDGHRLPTSELLGAPSVDLDSIPVSSIERLEILLGGASPTWGADAAAGVIHIIPRAETQGLEFAVDGGVSGEGDARRDRAAFFAGRVFGRGYVNAALEYRNREPVESVERHFSARAEGLACNTGSECVWPFGSTIVPQGAFTLPAGNVLGLEPGRYIRSEDGAFRPFNPAGPSNDLYSTQSDTFLRAGREGTSVTLRAGLEPSEQTRITFDALFSRNDTHRQLSALPLATLRNTVSTQVHPTFGAVLAPVNVAPDNFYNPFGIALGDVRRRLIEAGPRSLRDETETAFAAATVSHLLGAWELEGRLAWGRSETSETTSHVLQPERLALALGPSGPDANGSIRCGLVDAATGIVINPLPDCVPLDLFNGPGSVTPAMLEYIATPQTETSRTTQIQLRGLARREWAVRGLPSPARLAFGFELRRLSARVAGGGEGDVLMELLESAAGSGIDADGEANQQDVFGELVLPLARGADGPDRLTFSAGGRISRLENDSTIGSALAALTWRANEDVMLRGRFAQIFRAPTPGELFLGRRERVLPLGNPCVDVTVAGPLCNGTFAPVQPGTPLASVDMSYVSGGNPHLRAERGDSVSLGLAWNPHDHPDRFVSLDVSRLRLEDAIRSPGITEILQACSSGTVPQACTRLFPSAVGGTLAIDGSLINADEDEITRMDLHARDRFVTRAGMWTASVAASYLLSHTRSAFDGAATDVHGEFDIEHDPLGVAYPRLRLQASLQWDRGALSARWAVQHVGSYREVTDRNGWMTGGRDVASVTYHDLMVEWRASDRWSAQLNIENVLDAAPPRVNNGLEANTDAPTYRLEGRFVSLGVGIRLP